MKVLPKLTTFAIYSSISGTPIQSLLASASLTPRDAIETGPGRLTLRKHGGTSYNLLLGLLVLSVLFYLSKNIFREIIPIESETIFMAISTGILLHLDPHSLAESAGIPSIGMISI